jgi:hypothetical protein
MTGSKMFGSIDIEDNILSFLQENVKEFGFKSIIVSQQESTRN